MTFKLIHIMSHSIDEYDAFSTQCRIKLKEATLIFDNKGQNKTLYSMYSYSMEIRPHKSYYIFGEEIETKKDQLDVIKINSKTAEYKRYKIIHPKIKI